MLGRSWGDGVDGGPGMAGTAAPYAEWPEGPEWDDAGGDATQQNCVERWLIDGGRNGRNGCALD